MLTRSPLPCWTLAAALMFLAGNALATIVVPQNIEELESKAQTIFVGVCTSHTTQVDARGIPVTTFEFKVTQAVKGPAQEGATLVVRQFAGALPNRKAVASRTSAAPGYEEGREVLLFLNTPGRLGLTAPVGLGQGKFDVARDLAGNKTVVLDPARRKMLAAKMSASKYAASAKFSAAEQTLLTNPPERVELPTFCTVVRKLTEERERMARGK